MLMLMLTKMLKPPNNRISRITNNFTLPRAVPVLDFWAAITGGVLFLPIGAIFAGFGGGLVSAAIGGMLGVWIVKWKPWRGESVLRVLTVRARALQGKKVSTCPGSLAPVARDQTGAEFCTVCRLICEVSLLGGDIRVAARHTWRRKIYIGMTPIQPFTGVIWIAPGSVPNPHLKQEQPTQQQLVS